MYSMVNMMQVGYYTFSDFIDEDLETVCILYKIAYEVNEQNTRELNQSKGKNAEEYAMDNQDNVDFINSLREER